MDDPRRAAAAALADKYISRTGGPGVAPQPYTPPPQSYAPPQPAAPAQPQFSPETQLFIMRSGGVDQARERLSQAPPEGKWGSLHNELMPRPMTPPAVVTRPPTGLQGQEERIMRGRESGMEQPAMSGDPPISERKGGPINRYAKGGAVKKPAWRRW